MLLASPQIAGPQPSPLATADGTERSPAQRHGLSPAVEGLGDGRPMVNEPLRDFSQAPLREQFSAAVANVQVPRVEELHDVDAARQAIGRAAAAFPAWRDSDPIERSRIIIRAAALMPPAPR